MKKSYCPEHKLLLFGAEKNATFILFWLRTLRGLGVFWLGELSKIHSCSNTWSLWVNCGFCFKTLLPLKRKKREIQQPTASTTFFF